MISTRNRTSSYHSVANYRRYDDRVSSLIDRLNDVAPEAFAFEPGELVKVSRPGSILELFLGSDVNHQVGIVIGDDPFATSGWLASYYVQVAYPGCNSAPVSWTDIVPLDEERARVWLVMSEKQREWESRNVVGAQPYDSGLTWQSQFDDGDLIWRTDDSVGNTVTWNQASTVSSPAVVYRNANTVLFPGLLAVGK